MSGFKPLSEQTLMNNYVFSMVMRKPKRIKPLLENILGKKIKSIRMVEPEKTMKEKFESKGIRLDLYVENIEGLSIMRKYTPLTRKTFRGVCGTIRECWILHSSQRERITIKSNEVLCDFHLQLRSLW